MDQYRTETELTKDSDRKLVTRRAALSVPLLGCAALATLAFQEPPPHGVYGILSPDDVRDQILGLGSYT